MNPRNYTRNEQAIYLIKKENHNGSLLYVFKN